MKKTPDQVNIPQIVDENPLDIFQATRLNALLTQVESEVNSYVGLDPSVPADYKHIGTVAARISSFKTSIEKMGKALVDPIKAQAKEVDALRKMNKDRMDALRADFLAPRAAYDAEVLAHQQAVAQAFDLWAFGHSKVGEFGTPTLEGFDAMKAKMLEPEMTESFFGDRLSDAKVARESGLSLLQMRRTQWIEEEEIREAGRKALQAQKDAEAAERHAARQAESKEVVKDTVEKAGGTQKALDAIAQAEVHNKIVQALVANEVCSMAAGKALICAIYKGKIPNLQINY